MEHTKEPWIQDKWGAVKDSCGNYVVLSGFSLATGHSTEEPSANARHIVACVNACAGIRTEALEHRVHMLSAEDDTISLLQSQLETERASLFAESQRKQQLEGQVCTLLGALELLLCDVEEAEYMTGRASAKTKPAPSSRK